MVVREIIKNILRIPEEFHLRGNVTAYALLKQSGYFEVYNDINENHILENLLKFTQCAEGWIQWSENKRVDSGWYIQTNNEDEYVVGYYPDQNTYIFQDKFSACAAFIKKEIESIRTNTF